MNRAVAIALGSAGVGGALYLAYDWMFGGEGEPAPPVALPEMHPSAPSGTSGIPLTENEIEALKRVIGSEAGSGMPAEQLGIGWTVRNRFRGKSIYASEHPWRAQKGSKPPFSSARSGNDSHRKLAVEILSADQSDDPTGGATSFFEPRMQDAFAKAGTLARAGETGDRVIDGVKLTDITRFKNYCKDADAIRAKWSKGSTLYATAGRFEFWGSAPLFVKRGGTPVVITGNEGEGVEGQTVTGPRLVPRAAEIRKRGRASAARGGLLLLGEKT